MAAFSLSAQTIDEYVNEKNIQTRGPSTTQLSGYCHYQISSQCDDYSSWFDSIQEYAEHRVINNYWGSANYPWDHFDYVIVSEAVIENKEYSYSYYVQARGWYYKTDGNIAVKSVTAKSLYVYSVDRKSCPPPTDPLFSYPVDVSGNGEPDYCIKPSDAEQQLIDEAYENEANKKCTGLLLDAGNNTSDSYCYTSTSGYSCEVNKVSTVYGSETVNYYQGGNSYPLGCSDSGKDSFDSSGVGSNTDDCFFGASGQNYCKGNKDKHCTTTQGVETCDAGCFEFNSSFYCDSAKHPDVGQGESDYFNDKGTCSTIWASQTKGFCEENGGTWNEEEEYTQGSCPSSSQSGTCSNGSSVSCYACLDAGGIWNETAPTEPNTKGEQQIDDLILLTQQTNQILTGLESTNRKVGEQLTSTIKSSGQETVSAIDDSKTAIVDQLKKLLDKTPEETPQETFTANAPSRADSSLISGLFNSSQITQLQSEVDQLQIDLKSQINSIRTEFDSIVNIQAPSAAGYVARTMNIKGADIDISLNRFSSFFQDIRYPLMLVFSVVALVILLGRTS